NAIVAAQLPIAAGVAFAAKYQGQDTVIACYFGDGAVDEGAFHESLNLASVWKLPVVYVCENNQYSMGMAVGKAWAVDSLLPRAEAYNMPGDQVEGMDVLAVYDSMKQAVERARDNEGPTLLEIKPYRFRGHSMTDLHIIVLVKKSNSGVPLVTPLVFLRKNCWIMALLLSLSLMITTRERPRYPKMRQNLPKIAPIPHSMSSIPM